MKATAKDLRFHSKEILETTARGEEVIITFRGKPTAKIIPITSKTKNLKNTNKLFGIWKDDESVTNVKGYVRNLRKGRFK